MLIIIGTIQIDPSDRPVLEAAFEKMRAATLREPGCLAYQIYLDRGDAGSVLLLEKWDSEEALGAHFVTPHMAEFGQALAEAKIISTDVRKYVVSGESKLM